ncbi:DNA-binding protein, partial [Mycobacterium tuberculosis]
MSAPPVLFAVGALVLLLALPLRGVRASGLAFALPPSAFLAGLGPLLVWGLFRLFVLGPPVRAASAAFALPAAPGPLL